MTALKNTWSQWPDANGRFGEFGGRYVAETLMPLVLDLEQEYVRARADPSFQAEFDWLLEHYVGRPSPMYYAERMTKHFGGAKIYFKRDELNHTGAHKINNCIGQVLLARRMGKTRIIAETGAGQHGVATATICARFGLPCVVFMGETDVERQKPNVFRMRLLGAEIVPVSSGTGTLKEAMNEALRDWVTNVSNTFYVIGTAAGPHPYPMLVRDFQSVIGREARAQILELEGRLPDVLVAAIGGGSNAIVAATSGGGAASTANFAPTVHVGAADGPWWAAPAVADEPWMSTRGMTARAAEAGIGLASELGGE